MTFNLKAWIANVSTILGLLKDIHAVEKIAVSTNGTCDITLANLEHVFIIGVGGSRSKIVAVANCSSTGSVSSLKIAGETSMTLTDGTNKITVNNGYSYAMDVLAIKF